MAAWKILYSTPDPNMPLQQKRASTYQSLSFPLKQLPLLIMVIISTGSCQQEREKKL